MKHKIFDTVPPWSRNASASAEKVFYDYCVDNGYTVKNLFCSPSGSFTITTTFPFTFPLELS